VIQKVAPGDGVFKVEKGTISLASQIYGTVYAALSAHAVTAFHGHNTEKLYLYSGLRELHGGHESCETTANNDYRPLCVH
jgi:hypothetical protein